MPSPIRVKVECNGLIVANATLWDMLLRAAFNGIGPLSIVDDNTRLIIEIPMLDYIVIETPPPKWFNDE